MKIALIAMLVSVMFTAVSIYDFKVDGLEGGSIDLASFKGKKIMIVNTASECGFTPQYEELEQLYKKYQGKLVVIGFPANNFGGQEPGSNEEISAFCKRNYGVTFPMAAKISVKGEDMSPLYKYLVNEAQKKGFADPVKWNFTKFLIDEEGKLVTVFSHKTKPLSEDVLKYLN